MADHSKPLTTSTYANFVTEIDGRFDDLAVGLDPAVTTATNVPDKALRWNSALNKWQKIVSGVWGDLSALINFGRATFSSNDANATVTITQTGSGNAFVVEDASGDTTPFVIDADGRVNFGGTTWYVNDALSVVVPPKIQINGASTTASIGLNSFQVGTNVEAQILFGRSDSNTMGDFTDAVDSGDNLGSIKWSGADGIKLIHAATINAAVDGTPGANDMPGRLVFSTTADGASTPTERMRIDSAGLVTLSANGALQLSKTAVTAPAASDGNVFSGTYTPANAAADTNIAAITYYQAQYMRIGNTVNVSFHVSITSTASATTTIANLTLPIASNFTQANGRDGAGVAIDISGNQIAKVHADSTSDCIQIVYASSSASAREFTGTFQYIVK